MKKWILAFLLIVTPAFAASNFPTSLDSYSAKNSGDTIAEGHVNDMQDAIEALEAKVGIDSSAVNTSHDYLLANPNIVLDTTPQLGGDLDLNGKNIDFPTTANISDVLDEDTMSSDSATKLATQQSIKAYVDAAVLPAKLRPRGWATFDGTGATGAKTATDSHNVSGIVKNGTADYTISWDTDFANANYCVQITSGTGASIGYVKARAAGTVQIGIADVNGSAVDDVMINVIAFGSQ